MALHGHFSGIYKIFVAEFCILTFVARFSLYTRFGEIATISDQPSQYIYIIIRVIERAWYTVVFQMMSVQLKFD